MHSIQIIFLPKSTIGQELYFIQRLDKFKWCFTCLDSYSTLMFPKLNSYLRGEKEKSEISSVFMAEWSFLSCSFCLIWSCLCPSSVCVWGASAHMLQSVFKTVMLLPARVFVSQIVVCIHTLISAMCAFLNFYAHVLCAATLVCVCACTCEMIDSLHLHTG